MRISGRTELEAWVEIRQPKELKAEELEVFNSLRLSVVVLVELAEVLVEVLAEVLAEIAAEAIAEVATEVVTMEVASELVAELNAELDTELVTELKARVKIRQPKELKVFNSLRLSVVLLVAVRY